VTLAYGKLDEMREHVAPILNVSDAAAAVDWYRQLGFVKEWEHRFEAGLPLDVGIVRGEVRMHLSEHSGDAVRGLVYLYVDDVDAAAAAVGATAIDDMPWGRDFEVTDPDGNRIRIGTAKR
jgi:catechol 2,3-dioxygenase-like lactoylglutathione lyase family enzyme